MTEHICPACKNAFLPASNRQVWCGRECYNLERSQRRYRKMRGALTVTRACGYCSAEFASPDDRQFYCSDECTKAAKSLREAYRRYGITMAQYRALLLSQGGVCAICRQPERTARNRLLTIDHDHTSGHVRGLLCSQCNRAIGLLGDSPEIIEAAASYVRKNRQMKLVIA